MLTHIVVFDCLLQRLFTGLNVLYVLLNFDGENIKLIEWLSTHIEEITYEGYTFHKKKVLDI